MTKSSLFDLMLLASKLKSTDVVVRRNSTDALLAHQVPSPQQVPWRKHESMGETTAGTWDLGLGTGNWGTHVLRGVLSRSRSRKYTKQKIYTNFYIVCIHTTHFLTTL